MTNKNGKGAKKKVTRKDGKGHRVKHLSRNELYIYNNATHFSKWRLECGKTASQETQLVDWWGSNKLDYRRIPQKQSSIYYPSTVNIIDGNKCFGTVPFVGWKIATSGDGKPPSFDTDMIMHYKDYHWTIHMDTWRPDEGDSQHMFNEQELFEGLMLYKQENDTMINDSKSKQGNLPSKYLGVKPRPVCQDSKPHAEESLNYKDWHTYG